MAKHSYERARWNRREARRRVSIGGWWIGWAPRPQDHEDPELYFTSAVSFVQKYLSDSVHGRKSLYSQPYRRLWRRQAHIICRLHELEAHDEADNLDPQPRRLGVMWDIW